MSHANKTVEILAPRSKFYQGPFGRIFSDLAPWSPEGIKPHQLEAFLLNIANEEMLEAPGVNPTEIAEDAVLRSQLEAEFSSDIPAGYTYFGQFVDHDVTFDPASSLMRQNDPAGLLNHRTPRLDLDNVYGGGRADSPYLYDEDDRDLFLVDFVPDTQLPDLPRNRKGRALIGDPRNDENAMVSQLQLAYLCAHNALVKRAREKG